MKNLNITRIIALLTLSFLAAAFTGCSKEETEGPATVDQGVVFEFSRHKVYQNAIEEMDDIAAVKITLRKNGEKIVLPTIRVSGNADIVTSEPYALDPGEYEIVSYEAYAANASLLLQVDVLENNTFEVRADELTHMPVPLNVKIVYYPSNYLMNIFKGFCIEVWGDNPELWPWDMNANIADWDYLEFEEDDYGNKLALIGLNFSGSLPVYDENGILVEMKPSPFLEMDHLPECINRIVTLSQITLINLPNLKSLPEGIPELRYLEHMLISNCGSLESLPEDLGDCPLLSELTIVDTPVKALPESFGRLSKMYSLTLNNTQIGSLGFKLADMPSLAKLDLGYNPITELPDDFFAGNTVLREARLDGLHLAQFPSSIKENPSLTTLMLRDCGLTEIPQAVCEAQMVGLSLDDNAFTSLPAGQLAQMPRLEQLMASGNPLGSAPAIAHDKLIHIDLSRCGLTQMPDVSGCPELLSLQLDENAFTTISAIDFSANTKLSKLSMAGCQSLVSLPDDFGFAADESGKPAAFSALFVQECPQLKWTTPASWGPIEEIKRLADGNLPATVGTQTRAEIPTFDYVRVCRIGSPGVTFSETFSR